MAAIVVSTTPGLKRRASEVTDIDSPGQSRNFTPPPSASRSSSKQQIRHRASIACASCRERRIRCVVPEGETECTQCKRTGSECIIKNDDERRRPISKAYMSSLSNRIALLESMLQERGVVPPPAVHPPKTRQEAQARLSQEQQQQAHEREDSRSKSPETKTTRSSEPPQVPTPPGSGAEEEALMSEPEMLYAPPPLVHNHTYTASLHSTYMAATASSSCPIDPALLQEMEPPSPMQAPAPKKTSNARRILSAKGGLSFDASVGRPRYFGPTANSHVFAESTSRLHPPRPMPEQARRPERAIRALSPATHDYLMGCFWEHFNSVFQVVDQAAFESDRASQNPRFYSSFLHITMLAMGWRFANRTRDDVKRITVGNWESTLHRESRYMVEVELERPGGIPSVQALTLLADLECGVGRDATAWMYSGMGNRLAFDIGLHMRCRGTDVSELERRVRRRVMAACVLFDRKWALLFGRPTSIKDSDIGMDLLPRDYPLLSAPPATLARSDLGTRASIAAHAAIHQQLYELMEMGGEIADLQNSSAGQPRTREAEDKAYSAFVALDRKLHSWYRRLPEPLTWKPANVRGAPFGFFLLHQQFHVCVILLHRPWAKYGPIGLMDVGMGGAIRYPSPESPSTQTIPETPLVVGGDSNNSNRASLSRSMCTQHAIRAARIFWQHRHRHDGRRIGLCGVQHAGTAALALMAALAHKSAELDHQTNLRYLQVLSAAIYDMSHTYQPAARMYHLLKSMLVDIRAEMVSASGFDAVAVMGRRAGAGSSNNNGVVFGNTRWGAEIQQQQQQQMHQHVRHGSLDLEAGRLAKRRRMSAMPAPTSLSSALFPGMESSASSTEPGHDDVFGSSGSSSFYSGLADQGSLDLDFFHASFVDFINTAGKQHHQEANTRNDEQMSSSAVAESVEQPSVSPAPATEGERQEATAGVAVEDATPEMTIEEWLAERPVISPPAAQSGSASASAEPSNAGATAAPTTTAHFEPEEAAVLELTLADFIGAAVPVSEVLASPGDTTGMMEQGLTEELMGIEGMESMDWMSGHMEENHQQEEAKEAEKGEEEVKEEVVVAVDGQDEEAGMLAELVRGTEEEARREQEQNEKQEERRLELDFLRL